MPQAQHPDQTRRDLPLQQREAQIIPGSFNESENTVEVVWTVGARIRRYDWWTEQAYEEELVVSDEAVNMARFEAGAVQVLDNHRSYGSVESILGIASRGWISGSEGRATLRLSQRPELAGVIGDIRAGIIRTISVGYTVERYEIVRAADRTDGINLDLYRAARWTPMELSFVLVPADPAAGTRQAEQLQRSERRGFPCEFVESRANLHLPPPVSLASAAPSSTPEDPTMPQPIQPGGDNQTALTDEQRQAAAQEAQRVERERAQSITELCARHGVATLAAGLIAAGNTVDQARAAVLEELARNDAAAGGHRNVRVETVRDETQTRMAGIEEAIANRLDARSQLTDNGRQFRGMSLLEIGREHLERSGVNTRGLDRMTLASRIMQHRSGGMQGTSDFASLLGNVANRRLRSAYGENAGSYRVWARRAPNAPDFKSMSVVQMSGAPDLLQVNEHGEFTYGVLKDGKETYGLLTYGRIISLSRQAMVNDDLRGFDRSVTAFGYSAMRLENRTVYAQLTANAALADGTALFHADHANLATGGGSALSTTSLTTMRTAVRKQKGLQSEELNLVPSYLIVPAALEQTAYQLTSSNYVPAQPSNVNEFRTGGRTALEPVIEPVLDANSATAWYAAASSTQVDTVEYCFLDGNEGPVIESEIGFEVDGMQLKCRHDFAAKAIDFRGLYKAAGA